MKDKIKAIAAAIGALAATVVTALADDPLTDAELGAIIVGVIGLYAVVWGAPKNAETPQG